MNKQELAMCGDLYLNLLLAEGRLKVPDEWLRKAIPTQGKTQQMIIDNLRTAREKTHEVTETLSKLINEGLKEVQQKEREEFLEAQAVKSAANPG